MREGDRSPAECGGAREVEPGGALRVHLTNVTGLGAVQLAKSLLPPLEALPSVRVEEIYLPETGELASFARTSPGPVPRRYARRLPRVISRFLECTALGGRFDGVTPLLVLGDVPIRCEAPQTVLVQTPHLLGDPAWRGGAGELKYAVSRALFRHNVKHASAVIVQTEAMRAALASTYPDVGGKLHVVPFPVPEWVLHARATRRGRAAGAQGVGLDLVYPARDYPHKNHRLLSGVTAPERWGVGRLTLTVPAAANPNPSVPWLRCAGELAPGDVLALYARADGLVFLSLAESFGFPLVEAMWIGLPIVCPELPYARSLCGDEAVYFDPRDVTSLQRAIGTLGARLEAGWWPSWEKPLANLPTSWADAADRIARITLGAGAARALRTR